jgi:hypothetical protein
VEAREPHLIQHGNQLDPVRLSLSFEIFPPIVNTCCEHGGEPDNLSYERKGEVYDFEALFFRRSRVRAVGRRACPY